jgi:hypothetical protein
MTTPPRPEPPVRPDDTNPSGATRAVPPPPEKRKRRDARSSRAANPLYLPLWSVGLMLVMAFCATFSIISLVLLLGGNTPSGGSGTPRVVIITAIPSPTFDAAAAPTVTPTSPLLPSDGTPGAVPTFALEGPTLPPVILSPTPVTIAIGQTVLITEDQVRLRASPGLDGELISYLAIGTQFTVIGGPQQASSLTWWQVEDPTQPLVRGWVAADYLEPVPQPGAAT